MPPKKRKSIFMIHKHHATRLHYDLRIEIEGTLKSWALKELPLRPDKAVLAILVADHPLWYRHFEGVVPEGSYGAGPVMIFDKGLYTNFFTDHNNKKIPMDKALQQGCLFLWLDGKKFKGGYILVRISKKQRWLMIKMDDEYANQKKPKNWSRSVKSNKTLHQILKDTLKKRSKK